MGESRRRVLVFNHFAAPLGAPGGTRHVELFGRLDGWDFEVIAASRNLMTGERVLADGGLVTVPVTGAFGGELGRVLNWCSYVPGALVRGVRGRRPAVVYGSSPHLLAGAAAWFVANLRRAPFVLEIRDLWPRVLLDMGRLTEDSITYRVLAGLESFLYAHAAAIVVMAPGSRTELESRGIPADRIHFIPNGADASDFATTTPRTDLRQRWGMTRFTAVYAGAHGPANGLDLVLDAAVDLRDEPIDILLVGDGVTKAGLQERAASLGLSNVHFHDPIPKSQIPDLLAAADVGLHVLADVPLFHTSVSPNKVFDYLAAGLPVVTNCPGMVADLVQSAGAGEAVAPTAIAEGLRAMAARSEPERSALGEAGRQWLEENQSRTAMAARLAALLDTVAGR